MVKQLRTRSHDLQDEINQISQKMFELFQKCCQVNEGFITYENLPEFLNHLRRSMLLPDIEDRSIQEIINILDPNSTKKILWERIEKKFKKVLLILGEPGKVTSQLIQTLFNDFNINGTESLQKKDQKHVFGQLSDMLNVERLEHWEFDQLFSLLDDDSNNEIDYDEFVNNFTFITERQLKKSIRTSNQPANLLIQICEQSKASQENPNFISPLLSVFNNQVKVEAIESPTKKRNKRLSVLKGFNRLDNALVPLTSQINLPIVAEGSGDEEKSVEIQKPSSNLSIKIRRRKDKLDLNSYSNSPKGAVKKENSDIIKFDERQGISPTKQNIVTKGSENLQKKNNMLIDLYIDSSAIQIPAVKKKQTREEFVHKNIDIFNSEHKMFNSTNLYQVFEHKFKENKIALDDFFGGYDSMELLHLLKEVRKVKEIIEANVRVINSFAVNAGFYIEKKMQNTTNEQVIQDLDLVKKSYQKMFPLTNLDFPESTTITKTNVLAKTGGFDRLRDDLAIRINTAESCELSNLKITQNSNPMTFKNSIPNNDSCSKSNKPGVMANTLSRDTQLDDNDDLHIKRNLHIKQSPSLQGMPIKVDNTLPSHLSKMNQPKKNMFIPEVNTKTKNFGTLAIIKDKGRKIHRRSSSLGLSGLDQKNTEKPMMETKDRFIITNKSKPQHNLLMMNQNEPVAMNKQNEPTLITDKMGISSSQKIKISATGPKGGLLIIGPRKVDKGRYFYGNNFEAEHKLKDQKNADEVDLRKHGLVLSPIAIRKNRISLCKTSKEGRNMLEQLTIAKSDCMISTGKSPDIFGEKNLKLNDEKEI